MSEKIELCGIQGQATLLGDKIRVEVMRLPQGWRRAAAQIALKSAVEDGRIKVSDAMAIAADLCGECRVV